MNARTEIPFDSDEPATLRVPPHSVEAEQSVLGALLIDNAAFDRVGDLLTEASFYRHEHRLIFGAIGAMVMACQTADVVTVFERLQVAGKAAQVGGLAYLNDLAQSVAGASNARRYAEIVAGKALLRGVIAAADNVATAAFQTADPSKVLDEAQAAFTELGRTRKVREPVLVGSLAAARLDRYTDLDAGNIAPGISTGKPMLDEMLGGGLRAGLYVVAARPSVGKSSWSADVGMHIAEHSGKPVLFISQEMPRESVFDRCVARTGGVPLMKLKRGGLSQAEWGRVAEATERLQHMPFHIDDEPAQRLAGIRRKARAIPGLAALVVDYLQLCGSDIKTDNRNLQIEQLTRGLKALSTELAIPILALSQLNRSVEARAVKRPNLGDLRDSGAIEQDADVVIFLWPARENYDDKQAGSKLVGLAVDKNRDGALGEMSEEFRGWCQQWLESDHKPSQQTPREAAGGFQ